MTPVCAALEQALDAEMFRGRALGMARALNTRLRSPARIGVFDTSGQGTCRPLTARIGGAHLLPDMGLLPPTDLRFGAQDGYHARMPDGSCEAGKGQVPGQVLDRHPLLVQVQRPCDGLRDRSLLVIETDETDGPQGHVAALAWLLARTDLLVWLAPAFSAFERWIWDGVADKIETPAFLMRHDSLFSQGTQAGSLCPEGFEAAFGLGPKAPCAQGEDPFAGMLAAVDAVIDAARAHDLQAARLFLARHGVSDAPRAEPAARSAAALSGTATGGVGDTELQIDLGRLLNAVRRVAEDLRAALLDTRAVDGALDTALLWQMEDGFTRLAERADASVRLQEDLPQLHATFEDARDLATLLRIEGGAAQVVTLSRTLGQLRFELEAGLAA